MFITHYDESQDHTILFSKDGDPNFFIKRADDGCTGSQSLDVYSVDSWGADDPNDASLYDLSLYLSIYIKMDGCMHIWFGEKDNNNNHDGYIYLCGRYCMDKHINLMNYLYCLSEELQQEHLKHNN